MEVLKNKIVVNFNYNKILVMNYNFEILNEIALFDEISIYSSYVNENEELLLFCPENQCLVYIDLKKFNYETINISIEFANIIFSNLYQWEEENIKILSYSGEIYNISIKEKKIEKVKIIDSNIYHLYEVYKKNKMENVLEIFKNQYIGFLGEESILIQNFFNEDRIIHFKEKTCYHHVDYDYSSVLLTNDKFVKFISSNSEKIFHSEENYIFLKAKLLSNFEFIVISSDKSNSKNSKIEIFNIN